VSPLLPQEPPGASCQVEADRVQWGVRLHLIKGHLAGSPPSAGDTEGSCVLAAEATTNVPTRRALP
jgi:hypothetical protein